MTATAPGISLAEIGALVGDVTRARMLDALVDGRALTAGELAYLAGVTAQTASGHLAKLAEARLVAVARQGRHRYYRLASPMVAEMIEGMTVVAALHVPARHRPASRIDAALREARTCYDHLAGRLAVAMADALTARGFVAIAEEEGAVTPEGSRFFADLGVDLAAASRKRRCFCRPCLDWSERRPHLAGAVGAALAEACFAHGWMKRVKDSRAVTVTPEGHAGLAATFGIAPAAGS